MLQFTEAALTLLGFCQFRKGFLLKSWSHMCLSPSTWVPRLSEELLGWAAEMVSHRWKDLPSGRNTQRMLLICEMKARAQLFLYMSSCIYWEVSLDFFQRLCELHFGIYKTTSLMYVFMWQAMRIHCTSDESIKSCWCHANPLRCYRDCSNTHHEPDGPRLWCALLIWL